MAKRFTDTNKWRKGFVRGLQGAYKLLWLYIIDECDHAGIWHVEIDVAELRIGMKISIENAIKEFGNHIVIFDEGNKWFIPDFIDFQYGTLNPENRAHKSVLNLLEKYKIKGHLRPLQGCKDMDMVKEKDKDKETYEILFDKINGKIEIPKDYKSIILLWLKYKSEKRQTYKETGLLTLIKGLLKEYSLASDLKIAVEYSMTNNYAGLFKPKTNGHNKQNSGGKYSNSVWENQKD